MMFSYPNHGNKSSGEKSVRSIPVLCLFLLVALISSCNDQAEKLDNRSLLWHSLGNIDAAVLDQMLDRYEDLHPGVTIVREQISADEIVAQYERRVNKGLGPT